MKKDKIYTYVCKKEKKINNRNLSNMKFMPTCIINDMNFLTINRQHSMYTLFT